MEAHEHSDLDLILIVDDREDDISESDAASAFAHAWDQLDALGMVRPKPGGIYSVCARWKDLICPNARGTIDEDITTFGHRIQLLMDAQPVVSSDRFEDIQRSILHWYKETRIAALFDEPGPFHWLWQDVQRYWRSLRSRTCWIHAEADAKATMLNVKLRSSRLLLVFAFLHMLDRVQPDEPQPIETMIDSFLQSLKRTPTERLFGPGQNVQHWNTVWTWLKNWSTNPSPELPDEIRASLSELSSDIRCLISNGNTGQLHQPWLM